MIIGILTIEIMIFHSNSLKEKRMLIKSIKDKIKNKYNIAIAELEYLDKWQRSKIGIVTIGNENSHIENSLQKIFNYLDNWNEFEIIKYDFDYC